MNNYSNFEILTRAFPGRATLTIAETAKVVTMAYQTARNKLGSGDFPVPTVRQGRRRLVRLVDLAAYLDSLGGPAEPAAAGTPAPDDLALLPRRGPGRPTNAERAARQRAGEQGGGQ